MNTKALIETMNVDIAKIQADDAWDKDRIARRGHLESSVEANRRLATPKTYFDGDSPGCEWEGTPGNVEDLHGGFKVGDRVTYREPGIVNGRVEGYGPATVGWVAALHRNGNLAVRELSTGAMQDVYSGRCELVPTHDNEQDPVAESIANASER